MANGRLQCQEKALEGLTAGKWQASTPKKKLLGWALVGGTKKAFGFEMGFGAFACRVGGTKKAFGGFEGFGRFDGWQTAGFNAKKKLLDAIVAVASNERAQFYTSGGPRCRPCLGKGRGRRITVRQVGIEPEYSKPCQVLARFLQRQSMC